MADHIDFRMFTEPFFRMVADRERRMPNAARWAVREGGRVARRTARTRAPILKDKTVASHRQLQRRRKQGEDVAAAYDKPVPGLLRASITPSKNLKQHGDAEFSLKVGPRGQRVHLYAQKIERQSHYMAAGEAAAKLEMERIARTAFERVWRG